MKINQDKARSGGGVEGRRRHTRGKEWRIDQTF
jgi:hypothetical protein